MIYKGHFTGKHHILWERSYESHMEVSKVLIWYPQSSSMCSWDFPWTKPSSYWGASISGNPHIRSGSNKSTRRSIRRLFLGGWRVWSLCSVNPEWWHLIVLGGSFSWWQTAPSSKTYRNITFKGGSEFVYLRDEHPFAKISRFPSARLDLLEG